MSDPKWLVRVAVLAILFCYECGCIGSNSSTGESNANFQQVQDLNGNTISKLEDDKAVRFRATLGHSLGNGCFELFAGDDFEEYSGDSKMAIFSKLAFQPRIVELLPGNRKVLVSGRMTTVRNAVDTNETCGIVTGQLFLITEIDYQ